MERATSRASGKPVATASTAEIRLIWNAVRRRRSTLGRLIAMTSPSRVLTLSIPAPVERRAHERVTSWRQIFGSQPR